MLIKELNLKKKRKKIWTTYRNYTNSVSVPKLAGLMYSHLPKHANWHPDNLSAQHAIFSQRKQCLEHRVCPESIQLYCTIFMGLLSNKSNHIYNGHRSRFKINPINKFIIFCVFLLFLAKYCISQVYTYTTETLSKVKVSIEKRKSSDHG